MVLLYGGALEATLDVEKLHPGIPSTLVDVSQIRQVPDTQEVFMVEQEGSNAKWDRSVIFDLLEQVDESDYNKAIEVHIEDLAPGATNHFIETVALKDGLQAQLSSIAATNPRRDATEADAPGAVVTLIGLIRLAKASTDVVITMNIPVAKAEENDLVNSDDYKVFREINTSFKVHDWGLFGI